MNEFDNLDFNCRKKKKINYTLKYSNDSKIIIFDFSTNFFFVYFVLIFQKKL